LNFADIFGVRKLESLGYGMACLRDPTFSRFSTTPTCDRQTDRHAALAWRRAVKTTDLFDGAVDDVVISRVRIERSELHPAHAQLGRSVADEAADISADLTSQQRAILTNKSEPGA